MFFPELLVEKCSEEMKEIENIALALNQNCFLYS